MKLKENENKETLEQQKESETVKQETFTPPILEEITIEELAVDGICGIY